MKDPETLLLDALRQAGCDPQPKRSSTGVRGYTAHVPDREDKHPSLDIDVFADGVVKIIDRAGKSSNPDILEFIGLSPSDLFPKGTSRNSAARKARAKQAKKPPPNFKTRDEAVAAAAKWSTPKPGTFAEIWEYNDRFWVARYNLADGDKKFHPIRRNDDGTYSVKDPPGVLPLYNLDELADADMPIVVEGEKCVEVALGIGLVATTNAHGAKSSKKTDWRPLAGKRVPLLLDNDDAGQYWFDKLAPILAALGPPATVLKVLLPDLPEKGDIVDFVEDRRMDGKDDAAIRAEILTYIEQAEPWTPLGDDETTEGEAETDDDTAGAPRIVVNNRQLTDVSNELEHALVGANSPPVLFTRNKGIVRICRDDHDRPTIGSVGVDELRHRAGQCARFIKISGQKHFDLYLPKDVVSNILAAGQWPFPPLAGLVEVPVMRPDGSILDEPGYDADTRLFFEPSPDLVIPHIPLRPGRGRIQAAAQLIQEPFVDFSFIPDGEGGRSASRANACAMVIEPVVRSLINGSAPLGIYTAHAQGSGKGLGASVVSTVATGRPAGVFSAPTNEAEWCKQITSTLIGGHPVVVIDNVVEPLGSPSLAAVITAPIWSGRILGVSKNVDIPVRVTWIATGNNVRVVGDLPRRCYWVCIDPGIDQPWKRRPEEFKHPELLTWVLRHRGEIVAAILTLARAWHVAGRPPGPPFGSFESWARVLGGILDVAEIPGFLENRDEMLDRADDERPAWCAFLSTWRDEFHDRAVTVAEITTRLEQSKSTTGDPDFRERLPDDLLDSFEQRGRSGSFTRRLGKALVRIEGKRFDANGLRVERAGTKKNAIKWRVVTDA